MLIGIVHVDVDKAIGGGQTFFQNLIATSAHQFVFPTSGKLGTSSGNFRSVPLSGRWRRERASFDLSDVALPEGTPLKDRTLKHREGEILELLDLVQSFSGLRLDVLEIPDYLPYAAFIPATCAFLGVEVGKFALSMHGTLSAVLAQNWSPFGGDLDKLRYFEDALYSAVDLRYGIGPFYVRETAARLGLPGQLLDAGSIFTFAPAPKPDTSSPVPRSVPDVVFVGRHEKCKGPDIFLDLVSKLARKGGRTRIIGPGVAFDDQKSETVLKALAARRRLDVSFEVMRRADLIAMLRTERVVALFPSRIDTFNLAALEALMNGSPCAISDACGIVDYLETAWPGIPYVKIGHGTAADRQRIDGLVSRYDDARAELLAYLGSHERRACGLTIDAIYETGSANDPNVRRMLDGVFAEIAARLPVRETREVYRVRHALATDVDFVLRSPPSLARSRFDVLDARAVPRLLPDAPTGIAAATLRLREPGRQTRWLRLPFVKTQPIEQPLFDELWYLDQNPDILGAGVDARGHYRSNGHLEGRKPNRVFDSNWYLSNYPDVADWGGDPLDHYIRHGAAEGREPAPWFNTLAYIAEYPEAGGHALLHFLQTRKPVPAEHDQKSRSIGHLSEKLIDVFDTSVAFGRDLETWNGAGDADKPSLAPRILKGLERHAFSGDRVRAYRLAAEVERRRGNAVLIATYHLRALRLSGQRDPQMAEMVAGLLEQTGYPHEATAAKLLYGDGTPQQVLAFLESRSESLKTWSADEPELIVDRRTIDAPRISIIVSIYNGLNKAGNFLSALSGLPNEVRASLELVLVDSASPDGTAAWIAAEIDARTVMPNWLSVVLVKSAGRETIQKAWNRGVLAARGEYFSFMGIDEVNRPDGYGRLADYLDAHPDIDWVVSDALMQSVEMDGSFVADQMRYRRAIASKDDHLLDVCYVSYVGCLYRASIHRRFGYYDESFRAAGDTEFKNRLLRDISVGYLDDSIGFFANYPEERMTESPLAEIEDLRAWYLHRSVGGLMYRFRDAAPDAIVALFLRALLYRKSYMDRSCSDLELAANLAALLEISHPDAFETIAEAAVEVNAALGAYRMLDGVSDGSRGIDAASLQSRRDRIVDAAWMLVRSHDRLNFIGQGRTAGFRIRQPQPPAQQHLGQPRQCR